MNIGISRWRGIGLHAEDKGCGFGLGPHIQAPYSHLLSLHLPQLWTRAVVFKLLVADKFFFKEAFSQTLIYDSSIFLQQPKGRNKLSIYSQMNG